MPMRPMNILAGRWRLARWTAPLVVVPLLAGGVAYAARSSSAAAPPLPPRSAAQLLAEVSQATVPGLSGTVVETARLGLPALPSLGGDGGGGTASLSGLVSGSHTIRVWVSGTQHARLAVTGTMAESDVIRNGQDLWLYQSSDNSVTHLRLPAGQEQAAERDEAGAAGALTPQQAASQALAAITPTTQVTVDRTARVAGRAVYQLRLAPKDPRSLVGAVLLAVDGQTKVPLRVQVLAKGHAAPAFETGFTDVQFRAPDASVFDFTPPPGAKVTEHTLARPSDSKQPQQPQASADRPASAVLGSGWTAVLVVRGVNPATLSGGRAGDSVLAALLQAATPVQGAFGHGRLLRTALVSGLLTDDGRLYAGAVTPEALEAAAALPLADAKPLPLPAGAGSGQGEGQGQGTAP